MAGTTLGKELARQLVLLSDVIVVTEDKKQRDGLRRKYREASGSLQKLIDQAVPTGIKEYGRALEGLEEANDALKKAKEDIQAVAEAIRKVAKGLSLLARLAVAMG